MPDSDAFTSADSSFERLSLSGWRLCLTVFTDCSGQTVWGIDGSQGENQFKVDGATSSDAWRSAMLAAAACGMLRGWPRPSRGGG